MKITQQIAKGSACYKSGDKIKVKGLMLHSVGCPQPKASVFANQWNRSNDVCCHAIIDGLTDGSVIQTLPWDMFGWHCGDKANGTHIGIEMGEPDTIRYTGGANWVETGDGKRTKEIVMRTYKTAVELFAYLCETYKLDPTKDGVIISHYEGSKRGVASSHSDPEHIWKKYGLTMNQFRKDVKTAMGKSTSPVTESTKPSSTTNNATMYKVQVGAFKNKSNAEDLLKKIKQKKIDATVIQSDQYFKVQVGAFANKSNAEAQVKKVKSAGFDAIIVAVNEKTNSKPSTPSIKKGSTVKIKKGSKTYDNESLCSFVYDRKYKVSEISGTRAVITYDGDVVAAIKVSDLYLV